MKKLLGLSLVLVLLLFALSGCYSCGTWNRMWGTGPVAPANEHKFFLSKDCRPINKPEPVKKEEPKKVVKSECGDSSATGHYPCDGCAVVTLDKKMPAEVAINSRFDYTIDVTNQTAGMLSDVVVTENLPDNFKLADSDPNAKVDAGVLTFELGTLDPAETRVIKISGMATDTDCIESCASVTYIMPMCASVRVVQPALKLVKTAPAQVLLCDPIPVKFVVTNSGSGSAGEVKIDDQLPAGLKTDDGKSVIAIDAGVLAAGESKEFTANLKAEKTGRYENKAVASSSAGLKAEATSMTEVRQPVLEISKSGPENEYLGRPISYEIEIANKGDAAATDTIVTDTIPGGVTAVETSEGGNVSGSIITWKIGTLEAGAAKTVSVSYLPSGAGTVSNTAKATASCAQDASASAKTIISGIAAVLLEVVDISDPIAVGNNETYVITATNQGSAPDTNIKIVCILEDTQQYVSSSGATRGNVAGNTVTFEPLPTLAPKAKATWQVVVKAVKPGDVRFTTMLNTDQLTRPVQETEATNQYQ